MLEVPKVASSFVAGPVNMDAFAFVGYVFGAVASAGNPSEVRTAFEEFKHDHVDRGFISVPQAASMEQGWSGIRRRPDWPNVFATIGWRHARDRDREGVPEYIESDDAAPPMLEKNALLRMMKSFGDRIDEINPEQRRIFECAEALDTLGDFPLGRRGRGHLMMRGIGATWAALAQETARKPPFHEFAVARDSPTTSRHAVEFLLQAGGQAWTKEGWAALVEAADALAGGRLEVHLRMMRSMCEHVGVTNSSRAAAILGPWMVSIGLLPDRWGTRPSAPQTTVAPPIDDTVAAGLRLIARVLASVLVGKALTGRHVAHILRAMHRVVPPDTDIESAMLVVDDELANFTDAPPKIDLDADLDTISRMAPRVRAKITRAVQSVLDRRGAFPTKRLLRLQAALEAPPFKVQHSKMRTVVEPLRMREESVEFKVTAEPATLS